MLKLHCAVLEHFLPSDPRSYEVGDTVRYNGVDYAVTGVDRARGESYTAIHFDEEFAFPEIPMAPMPCAHLFDVHSLI